MKAVSSKVMSEIYSSRQNNWICDTVS